MMGCNRLLRTMSKIESERQTRFEAFQCQASSTIDRSNSVLFHGDLSLSIEEKRTRIEKGSSSIILESHFEPIFLSH